MLYSRSLLVIYFKYSSMYMSIPNSKSIHPHPSFLVIIRPFSILKVHRVLTLELKKKKNFFQHQFSRFEREQENTEKMHRNGY